MKQPVKFPPMRDGSNVRCLVRLSFVHLEQPFSSKPGFPEKYSVMCLVPKEDRETAAAIREAVEEAKRRGVRDRKVWGGEMTAKLLEPLKDGAAEFPKDEAIRECWFVNASKKKERGPVPLFSRSKAPAEPGEVYSGCWAVVGLSFFPFAGVQNGVSCEPVFVMKAKDDDRFDGRPDAQAEVEGIDMSAFDEPAEGLDDL